MKNGGMRMRTPERIIENAKQMNRDYERANQILNDAVKEAMPWAMPLAMNGTVPSISKIERLATQLMAILVATYPEDFTTVVKGFGNKDG